MICMPYQITAYTRVFFVESKKKRITKKGEERPMLAKVVHYHIWIEHFRGYVIHFSSARKNRWKDSRDNKSMDYNGMIAELWRMIGEQADAATAEMFACVLSKEEISFIVGDMPDRVAKQ